MKDNKKIITMTLLIIGIILIVGTSYAFFVYVRESSKNSQLIAGEIYMNYLDGTQTIGLSNSFPETYDEAMDREDNIFTFQVKGKNTSTKDLYYKIVLTYGDNVSGKTRIKDEDVKIYLERNGVKVIDGESFESINNKTILVETFDANTLQEQTIDYTLRIWFSEDILISDTAPYASYTTSEWKDIFANVKIKVEGQAGNNTFVKPLVNEINTKYASYLTDADDFGNRYISGTSSEITNNYVKFSGKLWRIVGINADGTIKLITESAVDYRKWDENGNADYATSTIRTWLNNDFLQTIDQEAIATSAFNYTGFLPSMEEIGEIKTLQDKVGLLSVFDYSGTLGEEGSYLINGQEWWLMTGIEGLPIAIVFVVLGNGEPSYVGADTPITDHIYSIRPVINLGSSTKIVEGNGTKENPYVISGEESRGDASKYNEYLENELTNLQEPDFNGDRYVVGDVEDNYLWYSGRMWRIVALNADGTVKLVTQNNVASIAWDINRSNNYSTSQVRNVLNNEFIKTLYNHDNLVEKAEWDYGYGIATDKVGMLTLNEVIFAGDGSLDMVENNSYLENGDDWWLMTPRTQEDNSSSVWYVSGNGSASGVDASNAIGVRPSINLKSGIRISGGDGSDGSPYLIKGAETDSYNEYLEARLSNLQESDLNGNRYVTGDVEDNYLWYSGKLWRIVSLNGDGTIKLVTQNNITSIAWDINNSNNYSTSQVRRWLNNEFIKTLHNNGELVEKSNWDYGYGIANDKVGMLTLDEYYLAGGFSSSYLNVLYYWWTMTPNTEDTDRAYVWYVYGGGASNDYATHAYGVRPSVNLKSGIRISGGDGSVSNPYRIEGDKETGVSNELLNNRISGEYVKFNGVKYRIVGIETVNNQKLTKITMADYDVNKNTIAQAVEFGNGGVFTDTAGIGLYLKNWYEGNSVDETSRGMIATKEDGVLWYQGPVTDRDYTKSKTGTGISATIGLPYYGEMFSSEFRTGVSDPNNYVDTWFMTRKSNSSVWGMYGGGATDLDVTRAYGVRPSMYLKSNVKLGDTNGDGNVGNGTLNYPYELVLGQ